MSLRPSPSLERNPDLDTWLEIKADGRVIIRSGKAELGQGLATAIARICAEELDVAIDSVRVETADTRSGPLEFMTVGSQSMEDSGAAVRQVCAEARHWVIDQVARDRGVRADELQVRDGEIYRGETRIASYAEVMGGKRFERRVTGEVSPKEPASYRYVGRPAARIDLREKFSQGAFLHDVAPEGMLHARVVRPPSYQARLETTDTESVGKLPGVVQVIRDGNFLAVIALREEQAIRAAQLLADSSTWEETPCLPDEHALPEFLVTHTSESLPVVAGVPQAHTERPAPAIPRDAASEPAGLEVSARYTKPYFMHASIGPSVGLALYEGEQLTVWSHSQGVAILRMAIAECLDIPRRRVRVIHVAGAGCYGHNGADDAAYESALLALVLPGRPIRVQWSREDEHRWEPYSPAACLDLRARIDVAGRVLDFSHEVRSNSHMGRPFPSGGASSNFVADWHRSPRKPPIKARPRMESHAGIHRNADPYYRFPEVRVTKHFVGEVPLRVSSTRGLGAFANVFAIESFIDELAHHSGQDPVALRLRYLEDPRAREVLLAVADRAERWESEARSSTADPPALRRGSGLAFARYKNTKCYAAVAVELTVDLQSGAVRLRRAVIAADAGQIIDADGLTNQLEGGFIQSASWTLYERVRFDRTRISSFDWDSYPILRFDAVPEMETLLFDRPGAPILGAGEATQGPTPAAIANAVFRATGVRVRDLPLRLGVQAGAD